MVLADALHHIRADVLSVWASRNREGDTPLNLMDDGFQETARFLEWQSPAKELGPAPSRPVLAALMVASSYSAYFGAHAKKVGGRRRSFDECAMGFFLTDNDADTI